MKKSTQAALFIMLFGLWRLSFASDWQINIAGGVGQANDPTTEDTISDVDLEVGGVIHIVANQFKSTDSDGGARLYTEYFFASNTITTTVIGGSESYIANIDAVHLQLGGVYEWTKYEFLRPYFAMTVGISHYTPEFTQSDFSFSGTLGLGARVKVTNQLSLRVEARAIGTLLEDTSTIFCSSEDCSIDINGSLWTQQHFTVGATWFF